MAVWLLGRRSIIPSPKSLSSAELRRRRIVGGHNSPRTFRPCHADPAIVPSDGSAGLRNVAAVDTVENLGIVLEGLEAVSASFRDEEGASIIGTQHRCGPSSV